MTSTYTITINGRCLDGLDCERMPPGETFCHVASSPSPFNQRDDDAPTPETPVGYPPDARMRHSLANLFSPPKLGASRHKSREIRTSVAKGVYNHSSDEFAKHHLNVPDGFEYEGGDAYIARIQARGKEDIETIIELLNDISTQLRQGEYLGYGQNLESQFDPQSCMEQKKT